MEYYILWGIIVRSPILVYFYTINFCIVEYIPQVLYKRHDNLRESINAYYTGQFGEFTGSSNGRNSSTFNAQIQSAN